MVTKGAHSAASGRANLPSTFTAALFIVPLCINPGVRGVLQLGRQGGQLAHVIGNPQVLDRNARECVIEVLSEKVFLASLPGNVFNLQRVGNLQGGVSEAQTLGEPSHDEDCNGEEEEGNGDVNI